MVSGCSMCNAHDGTENETMRGDVPVQEDGSGSKTTSGRASVPEEATFPNPTLKEAKILCVLRPCRFPCKTGVPTRLGSVSDKTRSLLRGITRMTETVGGTRVHPRNLPSFVTGLRMIPTVYTPARCSWVQRSWKFDAPIIRVLSDSNRSAKKSMVESQSTFTRRLTIARKAANVSRM